VKAKIITRKLLKPTKIICLLFPSLCNFQRGNSSRFVA